MTVANGENPAEHVDGRRARGDRRRTELIDATMRVVARDGVAGVTHRAVAAEAGVPKSAATYHFASLEDLLLAALDRATEQTISVLRGVPAGGDLDALAVALVDFVRGNRERIIAGFELYLLVARRPALRPGADLWLTAFGEILQAYTDEPRRQRLGIAALDGYFLQSLTTGTAPDPTELADLLRTTLY